MGLLYVKEHLSCIHYQKGKTLIEVLSLKKGELREMESDSMSQLFFLITGKLAVSVNEFSDKIIHAKEIFLIPKNSNSKLEVLEDVYCLLIHFHLQVSLCESFSMTQLYPHFHEREKPCFTTLKFNEHIDLFVKGLDLCMQDKINCIHFYELKKQEVFLLFRAYYSKSTLADFFEPVLDREDMHFRNFVLEHCLKAKNIQDLASKANYSTSGFIKKFVRSFDASPHHWISEYKANHILHEINVDEKSLKQIYIEYNFSSMSHFVRFCKKHYDSTPSKMRKKEESLEAE